MVPAKSTGLLIELGAVLLFIAFNGAEVIPLKVLPKADIIQTRAVSESISFWRFKRMCYDMVFRRMKGQKVPQSCDNGKCAGVDYHTILKMYPGIFFNKAQIERIQNEYLGKKQNIKRSYQNVSAESDSNNDWDKCCPTSQYFTEMATTLRNVDGQVRTIVHLTDYKPDPMYQAAHIGICEGAQTCDTCQQQNKLHQLLVIDPAPQCWPPLMFDLFELQSYCSCKNYSRR